MLHLHNIEKNYGEKKVLDRVNLHIAPREKAGLIGVNGSGKTTLLKIISGHIEPEKGQVVFSTSVCVSYLSQEVTVSPGNSLHEEMKRALPDMMQMERRLRFLENEMAACSDNPEIMEHLINEYSSLHEKFDQNSGHDLSWKIDRVIQGLGFSPEDRERNVSEFSGGWQMRIELAKLLLQEKDILLLDEPTNHLDLNAVEWLEDYLKTYPGAVIIVSHDRYFLNRVTSRTIHLERGRIKTYPGDYDFFVKRKELEREQQQHAFNLQEVKLVKDRRFIERFRAKNTLATRVKSREKMLEKMDKVKAPEKELKSINLSFDSDGKQMTTVYMFKDLQKNFPGKTVPLSGEIEIPGGERIAVVGENGCGKTTLFRILSGVDRSYDGKLKVHRNAKIKFYMQNQAEQLNEENTALQEMEAAAPSGTPTVVLRTILGSFLFRGDDVFKKVSVLSGGEKSRLAIARMVVSSSNILLMDEPTNHLDFQSRESLADALNQYEGTVMIVSHDRYFIDQVCSRVIEIENGQLIDYPGNFTYYRQKKKFKNGLIIQGVPVKKKKKKGKLPAYVPSQKEKISKHIGKIEETIAEYEARIEKKEYEMEKPENMANEKKIQRMVGEYANLKSKLEESMNQWEEMHEMLENE
ncbi:MAG: ABC-F family ATP-binding cassette domain-containing protein [Candidatus Eremiobacteraeota bacterium]|nr:ABC-F family ATP-binding cassette domain-containing protein [Candidatus Eremiobacteraeota bacterium]